MIIDRVGYMEHGERVNCGVLADFHGRFKVKFDREPADTVWANCVDGPYIEGHVLSQGRGIGKVYSKEDWSNKRHRYEVCYTFKLMEEPPLHKWLVIQETE